MSTSLTKLLPTEPRIPQVQHLLTPKTLPIPLLSDPLAEQYNYAHTAWLLLYYYLRSGMLVNDPLNIMALDIVPLLVGQCMFCAVCIPSSGTWISGTTAGKIIEGTASSNTKNSKSSGLQSPASLRKRDVLQSGKNTKTTSGVDSGRYVRSSWTSRIMPCLLSLIFALAIPPAPLFLLALVMGAPLYPTSLLPHTMLLSVHISLLATLPIFYSHGVSSEAWRDLAAAWLPFDEAGVWSGTVGTFVGAWVGAIPMALDWDRDWQQWPCTVLWGAVLGWGIGRLLTHGFKIGIGKRIDLSEAYTASPTISTAKETKATADKDK